jgi:hypothetical protein
VVSIRSVTEGLDIEEEATIIGQGQLHTEQVVHWGSSVDPIGFGSVVVGSSYISRVVAYVVVL